VLFAVFEAVFIILPLKVLKNISVLDVFDLNKEQNSEKFKSSFGLISFFPKGAKNSYFNQKMP
jgi:hypothetical protein